MKRAYLPPIAIVLGSVSLWNASSYITAPAGLDEGIGPAFFPRLALAGMILVGLAELGRLAWRRAPAEGRIQMADGEGSVTPTRFYWRDLLATVVIGGLYVGLMRIIGFIPATILFQMAMLAIPFRQRRLKIVVGAPLGLTLFYYVVFLRLMEMPLPQGHGIFRTFSQLVYG